MPLQDLSLRGTKVNDLSPLAGMPLTKIDLGETPIIDLSPLRNDYLSDLTMNRCKDISDFSPLEACRHLANLNVTQTKVTPAQVAALQKALPNCKIEWDGAEKRRQAAASRQRERSPGNP